MASNATKKVTKKVVETAAAKAGEKAKEHIEAKETELKEKAAVETVWYKRVGFYVAAAVGAAVVQLMNLYGSDLVQIICNLIENNL